EPEQRQAVFGELQAEARRYVDETYPLVREKAVRMAPAAQRNELFGLMAFSGKATTFLGPFLVAALTAASGSQRIGLSVVLFMFAGALLLTAGIATDRPGPKAR
ncbi:MAG TPA: hypothetical protein DDW98_14035, partial [Gammaproteobacteria bacterium]|nr:hypothetical protein [Gammaproteobacteria bacterium]